MSARQTSYFRHLRVANPTLQAYSHLLIALSLGAAGVFRVKTSWLVVGFGFLQLRVCVSSVVVGGGVVADAVEERDARLS